MELAALGIIGGLCVAGITVLSFWMNFSDRITKSSAAADAAKVAADEADQRAHEAATQAAAAIAGLSLFREQVARDYIHREDLRELKEEIKSQFDRLASRLDRLVEHRT